MRLLILLIVIIILAIMLVNISGNNGISGQTKSGGGEHISDYIKAHERLQENYDEILEEIKRTI